MPYALELRQRFTPLQNRYDLVGFHNGTETQLGYAEQKRMALKERITFFSDDAKTNVVFTLGARSVMELNATYDIAAADGTVLATLRKEFGSSLLRSTYELTLPDGRQLVCRERTIWKALFRRFVDLPLFALEFDVLKGEQVLATVDRKMQLRDVYAVQVNDDSLDWRVMGAVTVAQDAFMNR